MKHADQVEIHQHVLEKLINQRTKSINKLTQAQNSKTIEKYLEILQNICKEELEIRKILEELYKRR